MQEQKEFLQKQADETRHVVELRKSPGFQVLKRHFEQVKTTVMQRLTEVTNHDEIMRLQERYRAFNAMLEAVEHLCQMHSKVQEELADIAEDEQFKLEYGLE